MDRLARSTVAIAIALAVLAGASGLVLVPGTVCTPAYFGVVRLHVAAGHLLLPAVVVAAGVGFAVAYRRSGWQAVLPTVAGFVLASLAVRALADVGWLAGEISLSSWLGTTDGDREAGWGTRVLLLATVGGVVALAWRDGTGSVLVRSAAMTWIVGLCWASGAVLLHSSPRVAGMDPVHSAAGVGGAVLAAAWLAAQRWRTRRVAAFAVPLVTVFALALVGVAWSAWYRVEHGRSYGVHDPPRTGGRGVAVQSTPATREQMADTGRPRIPEAWLAGSLRCGQPNCHPRQTHQWAGSNHRFSADNLAFQRVVGEMIGELGPESASACLNCHDPVRVLAGTAVEAWTDGAPAPMGEGVSCAVCHLVVDVPQPPANGVFTVRVPPPYPGRDLEAQERNIRLDPRQHARDFFPERQLLADDPCVSCHFLDIGPELWMVSRLRIAIPSDPEQPYAPDNPGAGLTCGDCHLLVAGTSRREGGRYLYDHEMPAVNPDMHQYAISAAADDQALADASACTLDYLHGRTTLSGDLLELVASGVDERAEGRDEALDAFGLVAAGPLLEVTPVAFVTDDGLDLLVTTRNHRSAHTFPSGSKDFRQVWLEVQVHDASGALVASHGALDEDERLPADAHRLGGTVLDVRGEPLARHRVWEVAGIHDVRVIPPVGEVEDRYSLTIPDDAAFPLRVAVRWNLRHASAEFTEYVLQQEGARFPTHVIGEGTIELQSE